MAAVIHAASIPFVLRIEIEFPAHENRLVLGENGGAVNGHNNASHNIIENPSRRAIWF